MLKVAISLSEAGQADKGRRLIIDYLSKHGVHQTGGGLVSLTFVAEADDFDEVFKSRTKDFPATLSRTSDSVGSSGLFEDPPIVIPDLLSPLIDYVSILPPARHFDNEDGVK